MQIEDFYKESELFLKKLIAELKSLSFCFEQHWDIDHLCYRTTTDTEYETLKADFSEFSTLLIENSVNGRMISTFKLTKPICFENWQIDLIELPAPKNGKNFESGFEHIEVEIDTPFGEVVKKYPQLAFDTSSLQKTFNKELKLKLSCGSVKFHHLSLNSVIQLEKNIPVFNAVETLGILSAFKEHDPLIAGTFPLGIQTPNSDVDILMNFEDLDLARLKISERYSTFPEFQIRELIAQNLPSVVCSFIFKKIPFEIFVQQTPSCMQQGYLHFLVEERLLKLGGNRLRERILDLRSNGLKTEPAFATALNLPGNPYQQLCNLQKQDTLYLKSILKKNKF